MKKLRRQITIIDIFIVYICFVSLLNVFLLSINYFYPFLSPFLALVLLVIILLIFKIRVVKERKSLSWFLIPILLVALLLRLSPNLYLTGGQDQGTYVSLSKQYQENHSLYIEDELREELPQDGQKLYDRSNIFLGLELIDKEASTYIMPFYPVSPSWMAIFGEILGSDNRVYALTMFGVLSVLGMYLFSYEISDKNKKVGLLASFILAINPLHVYFSRVPLTEIVALTFFLFSFYYLMRYLSNRKGGKRDVLSLFLSLLTINVFFYTRMTAMFYLPVIILFCILSYLFVKDKDSRRTLGIYTLIWIFTFAVSYLFYAIKIPFLFNLIIGNRLPKLSILLPTIGGIIGLMALIGIVFKEKFFRIVRSILKWSSKNLFIFVLVIFVGLIGYQLFGYIMKILIDGGHTLFSFESLSKLKELSFLATVLYLSPLGFLLLPVSLIYFRKKKDVRYTFLL